MKRNQLQSPLQDEITPRQLYQQRRQFLRSMGFTSAAALLAACAPDDGGFIPEPTLRPDTPTDQEIATSYNNYYEFSFSKEGVKPAAKEFTTQPWQVEVSGLVANKMTLSIDDIIARYKQEERIYRMRCVEGWSMVLPWLGFPLHMLLDEAEPLPEARYIAFETVYRPNEMPVQKSEAFPFPYMEGLRLDEALHDLTILATGMYGDPLEPQNGAPIRLVVPWKYGFKSIKSIVKISLVVDQPVTTWSSIAPEEYGFYANVNPKVDHPRWSQASESRIGESSRRPTLLFNGYEDEVGYLYNDLDLKINY